MSPEALDPASPSRDINAIVEAAAKRFEEMDEELKSLIQDMKNYQAAMQAVSENRLKVRESDAPQCGHYRSTMTWF
jgi:predicted nucleotidyltransferase